MTLDQSNKNFESALIVISISGSIVFRSENAWNFLEKYLSISEVSSYMQFNSKIYSDEINELRKKIEISLKNNLTSASNIYSKDAHHSIIKILIRPFGKKSGPAIGIALLFESVREKITDLNPSIINFAEGFYFVFKCDSNFKIISFGSEREDLIPENLSEIIGQFLQKIIPNSLYAAIKTKEESIKNSNFIESFEHKLYLTNNVLSIGVRVFHLGDEFILILKDLSTERKKEDELNKFVEELHYNKIISEQYAHELTLVNKKLNDSEIELKQLNLDKDKFVSILAHDLRSPFTALLGFAEILAEDVETLSSEEITEYSSSIFKTGKQLLSLLDNMLQWSRMQQGRIKYEPEEYLLPEQLENVMQYYTNMAEQKSIRLILEKSDENLVIYADKYMIETVIRNLVSNALKFTNINGTIKVSYLNKIDFVEIYVTDDGVGIPRDVQEGMFKLKSHKSTTGTAQEPGTGLGLILCKEFVEKNNGTLSLNSEVNKGTTFTVKIPHKDSEKSDESHSVKTKTIKSSHYKFSK